MAGMIVVHFAKEKLRELMGTLKVGDEVVRDMKGIIMNLKVTSITNDRIICNYWEFDKETGDEIDEDCTGTLSYILPSSYVNGKTQ
jgi:hypothetical protein